MKINYKLKELEVVTYHSAKLGLKVKRGPSWCWNNQDNNSIGVIIELPHQDYPWVKVRWTTGKQNDYRVDRPDLYLLNTSSEN